MFQDETEVIWVLDSDEEDRQCTTTGYRSTQISKHVQRRNPSRPMRLFSEDTVLDEVHDKRTEKEIASFSKESDLQGALELYYIKM